MNKKTRSSRNLLFRVLEIFKFELKFVPIVNCLFINEFYRELKVSAAFTFNE